MVSRFQSRKMMEAPGIPSTRWFDAVTLPKDQVEQNDNVRGVIVFGYSPNAWTRLPEVAKGIEKLDLLVVADPHPTQWAVLSERKNGTYLLPTCTQYEAVGSRTASNGSLQWYEQIIKPLFETKSDNEIVYLLAKKLGFADQMFKNIKVENNVPVAEEVLREINRGGWSTGYTGQSPERLKAHLKNQAKFDLVTLRAPKDDPEVGGDYYGLPWPCWGTPDLRHPGTPILYNTNAHVMEGGGTFRARFGVEREVTLSDGTKRKDNLLAAGLLLGRVGDQGRLSRVHAGRAQEARLGQGPQAGRVGRHRAYRRRQSRHRVMVDRSLRRHPAGCSPAWLQPVRQRQSTRDRVELAGSHPGAPRADLLAAAGTGREISDASQCQGVPRAQRRFRRSESRGREGDRQGIPANHDLGPPGRIRRRRRGDPLQQVARRTTPGHVHRDQSCRCQTSAAYRRARGSKSGARRWPKESRVA